MQNIFRNKTVKNLTILDNPFKRYNFSKFSLNSVKSLCRPHKLATVPCHGCTTPHWFCTQIITNFQFSWIWVKLLIKLIPKSIQIHIYPKQTWLISRGNLLFTWELYVLKIFVYITNEELCTHDMVQLPTCEGDIRISQNLMKTLKNHISWMDYPFLSKFWMFIAKKYSTFNEFIFFSEYSVWWIRQVFFLIFRKCRKSSENTIRPSCNCFEIHIVMQYCPGKIIIMYIIITYGKEFGGTPNIFMFWIFPENGNISERTDNRALIVHTTL